MGKLLTSGLGLGFLPIAPGTWGSLLPVVVLGVLLALGAPAAVNMAAMAAMVIIFSLACVKFAPQVIAATGSDDPGQVVADEVAGQALAFMFVAPMALDNICGTIIAGFVLFRIFDILKPWPIRKLEKLDKGVGILADDLAAGAAAGILLLIAVKTGILSGICGIFTTTHAADGSMALGPALLLGVVQGFTEFLPVSSSGHLVLFEHFFGFDAHSPDILFFDLAVHVGTVISILIVFRDSMRDFFMNLLNSRKYGPGLVNIYKRSPSVRFALLGVLATFVTGVIGLGLKDYFTAARGQLLVVAAMWVVTGSVLMASDMRKRARLSVRDFGIIAAIIVGVAQATAIMPGISRSGATICAAILIGLHRRWAVEFSFLLAIPAIIGATILEARHLEAEHFALAPLLIGTIVAAAVGVFALKLLINLSRKANLKYFACYCYSLAVLVALYVVFFARTW